MDINFSIVKNSTGNGLFALVMRAWYVDEEGSYVPVLSEVKTGITYGETILAEQDFVRAANKREA